MDEREGKTQEILDLLAPMKERARREDLMFQHTGMHSELRLTADELDKANAEGRLIWTPVNWELQPKRKPKKLGPWKLLPKTKYLGFHESIGHGESERFGKFHISFSLMGDNISIHLEERKEIWVARARDLATLFLKELDKEEEA